MSYTANNFDTTNPTDAVFAETAQAEFRNMKTFFQGTLGRSIGLVFSNTLAANTMMSVIVPANSMGTVKKLRAEVRGLIANATGAGAAISFQAAFGSNGLISNFGVTLPGSGSFAYKLSIEMAMSNSVIAETVFAELMVYAANSNSGQGTSPLAGYPLGAENSIAVDQTVAQLFAIVGTMNELAPAFGFTVDSAVLEWM